jgi:ribonuclease HI
MLRVWCDGSSNGRSGSPTGWGYIIEQDGRPLYSDHGGESAGTNNTAEVTAAIEGLKGLEICLDWHWRPEESIVLCSDSMYTLNSALGVQAAVKNVELVNELRNLYKRLCTDTFWVPGHSGHYFNEMCDKLAKKGRRERALEGA